MRQPDAASCSGYYSDATPPPTINVLYLPAQGGDYRVHAYAFKDYVKWVLPNEWFTGWDLKALRFGAVAVMTYGWYWVNHSQHQTYNGQCYDVDSSTAYQKFIYGSNNPATDDAVDAIWTASKMYRRQSGSTDMVFQANYNAGLP